MHDVQPLPATPADVAKFIADCAPLGIEKLWPIVGEISRAHYLVGLADPTLGGWVAHAINEVSKVEPPRSWPKEHKARFQSMPYDLQIYVANHEAEREKVIRRAQNDAALARQGKLPAKVKNGNTSHSAAR